MKENTRREQAKTDERLLRIGNKLKKLRIEKGFTSYESFAFTHELPRVGYGKHEKGGNITMVSLLRLLDIHNISLKEFFEDIE